MAKRGESMDSLAPLERIDVNHVVSEAERLLAAG
jgi:hypothetical protein